MTRRGTSGSNRWGLISVLAGGCALAAAAAALQLKRLVRVRLPAPAAVATPAPKPAALSVRPARPAAPPAPLAISIPARVRRESGEVNASLVFVIVFGWFVFVFIGLAALMYTFEMTPPYPKPPLDSSYPAPRLILHPFALQPPYLAAQSRALATGAMPISHAMAEIAARPDPYAPIAAENSHGH